MIRVLAIPVALGLLVWVGLVYALLVMAGKSQ